MANLYNVPLQNNIQRTLANTLNAGETSTITFSTSVSAVLQASASIPGLLVIDRVDANGTATPSLTEYISFTGVSGSTVTGLTRGLAGSSDIAHSVGAIVEFVPDVTWADAINDTFLEQHNADGTHKPFSGVSFASGYISNTEIKYPNLTLSVSALSNATQGNIFYNNFNNFSALTNGNLKQTLLMASSASGLVPSWGDTTFLEIQRQGSNATVYPSGGSTNYLETGVFMQFGAIDCVGMTTSGSSKNITFPKAFTQTPLVWITFYDATSNHFGVVGNVRSITTTGFTIINNSAINSGSVYQWFAAGK